MHRILNQVMKPILFILSVFISTVSLAQTGSVAGTVLDKDFNEEPLAFANVLIKGTTTGTTSDMDGVFSITNLNPGNYTLEFSFVGYETQEIPVEITAGKVTEITVIMSASTASLDEVVIKTTTKKESESALLLEQKKAVAIQQSIGAEELSRKGVSDAAAAVAKISGVSKQEGSSNVYVRGLGDRYLNTTLNGLSLPSNDVNKKNIDLNLFASDVIENVSISKTYASKFYADFSAGNVNINSKDYKGDGMLHLFGGVGFNTNAISKDFVRSEGTGYFGYYNRYQHNPFAVVLSHGVDPVKSGTPLNISYGGATGTSFDFKNGSRLSLFATASFENSFNYRKGKAIDFTTTYKKKFDNSEEFDYGTTTTAMGAVNYRIDDANKVKFNSLFINNSSDVVGYYGIDGNGYNRDSQSDLDDDKGFYQMNVQFDQTQMFVNQLLGNHKSNKLEVDWGLGVNVVNAKQPDRKRLSLENYQLALDTDPSTNPIFYTNVDYDNQRYFQSIKDVEYNGNINLAYTLNDNVKLNFGYNGKSKKRNFSNIRYGYKIVDKNYEVTNVNNFDSIFNLDNLSLTEGDGGIYQIKVFRGIPTNPNNPNQTIGTVNRPGLPENTYYGNLNVYAGYVDAEIKAGDKWMLNPGVRFESNEQTINYDVINLANQGIGTQRFHKNFFLPSLNVRYTLQEDMNLRFSGSQTISLPEFKEIAPFVYENISNRIGGNPDIIGYSKIWNFDIKYEWFMSKNEILSFAAFTKSISNPINLVIVGDATGTQRFMRTGDKANVFGVEFEARKNVLKDANENDILSIGFNATYMHTKQDLKDVDGTFDVSFDKDSEKLQGASPFIVNADVRYSPEFSNYKPTLNLVFSYFSDRIDALGSGEGTINTGNTIEKGIPTLDFIWKNNLNDTFEINFAAKNLLNPRVRYMREGTNFGDILVTSANGKGVTNYKNGIDLSLQLKYKF